MSTEPLRNFLSRHDRALRTFCRIGFGVCVVAVCVLSLLPGRDLPHFDLSDKVEHAIAYAAIATLGLLGYRGTKAGISIMLGAVVMGGALEIGQRFVPGRSSDILDFAANSLGVLAGLLLAGLLSRLWAQRAP